MNRIAEGKSGIDKGAKEAPYSYARDLAGKNRFGQSETVQEDRWDAIDDVSDWISGCKSNK
jgi:hypothetical protein